VKRRNPYARPDAKTRAAKASGYPARSVFKLAEIDKRLHLLRQGQRVLDLGAAPGSWARYAGERVGKTGSVLCVDLQTIAEPFQNNVLVLEADVLAGEASTFDRFAPYDVVLSDMAPSTSGSKVRDQALSFELYSRALELAAALGRPGSSFVGKIFMGPDFQAARAATARLYEQVKVIRPEGTRKESSELFVVGLGLRKAPPPSD
jgi:23S rRNA (uridine2552-2'-O)-methyltransferase